MSALPSPEIQFGLTHNYVSQIKLGLTILDQENIKLMKIVEIDHENWNIFMDMKFSFNHCHDEERLSTQYKYAIESKAPYLWKIS